LINSDGKRVAEMAAVPHSVKSDDAARKRRWKAVGFAATLKIVKRIEMLGVTHGDGYKNNLREIKSKGM
jgi:hypothetical protein